MVPGAVQTSVKLIFSASMNGSFGVAVLSLKKGQRFKPISQVLKFPGFTRPLLVVYPYLQGTFWTEVHFRSSHIQFTAFILFQELMQLVKAQTLLNMYGCNFSRRKKKRNLINKRINIA